MGSSPSRFQNKIEEKEKILNRKQKYVRRKKLLSDDLWKEL